MGKRLKRTKDNVNLSIKQKDYRKHEVDFLEIDGLSQEIIDDLVIGDSTELEFNIEDFDIVTDDNHNNRYIKPKVSIKTEKVKYENCQNVANKIKLKCNEEIHAIVSGNFIFGDFIEALLVEKNVICKNCYISTLSLSENNIDSLNGLMVEGYIENLNLIISNYFYSHERDDLIPYLLEKLDIDNRLNLIIVRNHTKICLLEIEDFRIIIIGSANLRSSNCLESFIIKENKELYNWYKDFFEEYKEYNIIDKRS